jgi:preprotein translocase subunit YajC
MKTGTAIAIFVPVAFMIFFVFLAMTRKKKKDGK